MLLAAYSSDGKNAELWPVSLDPAANTHVTYRFVPQQEGGTRLTLALTRGTASTDMIELA